MRNGWPGLMLRKPGQDKELALKELELEAQAKSQASTSATVDIHLRNRDSKAPKLPDFKDRKDPVTCFVSNATPRMPRGRNTRGLLSRVHCLHEELWIYIPGRQMEMLVTTTS